MVRPAHDLTIIPLWRTCRIRPILYRVAIAETTPYTPSITIRNWKNTPRTHVARFVRHLLTTIDDEYLVLELLSTLRNLENLAMWGYLSISSEILKAINDLPLHTLSANLGGINLAKAIKNCTAFRNLIHLEILGLTGCTWKDCNALLDLPKLTHLSFHQYASVEAEVALKLLECSSSLRVLIYQVIFDSLGNPGVDLIKSNDPRYFVFRDDLPDDVTEWEASANGQTGFWELADIIVEARKGRVQSFFFYNSLS